MPSHIPAIKNYLLNLQETICQALETIDGAQFTRDTWERPKGGSGSTHVLSDGAVIEKAGVNFSHVYGENLPPAATERHPELAGQPFQALGLSVIVHPRNPFAPTAHFNIRFFFAEQANDQTPVWWIGGGFDLTPYYGFAEDCIHWHQQAKAACDTLGKEVYAQYKKAADDYFYLKHRQEPRGIGGIFFDDVQLDTIDNGFAFMQSVGDHFLPAYLPILQRRIELPYGAREREFQCYRRGRYVEFNLLWDRGTLFGLQWGGRVESILVSLPPIVNWHYNWQPEPGSREAELYERFLIAQEWIKD